LSTNFEGIAMNKKELEKQNRHLLWLLMEHSIHRYLFSNTHGRLNGYEKAEQHITLSAIFLAYRKLCSIDKARTDNDWIKIHDATKELTDHLDTEIGFPIYECPEDYDELARKFFDRFVELADKAL
jgi:hypothetical protein